jgi:hypothetical protein
VLLLPLPLQQCSAAAAAAAMLLRSAVLPMRAQSNSFAIAMAIDAWTRLVPVLTQAD